MANSSVSDRAIAKTHLRVSIHTLGTRGDVQPYVALAKSLKARGHEVQLAAPTQFENLVVDQAIPFAGMPGEMLDLINTPQARSAIAEGSGFSAGFKLLKYIRPLVRKLLDAEWETARNFRPDIVIGHPKSLAAPHVANRLGKPFVLASPLPGFTPTSEFPSPMAPIANLGPLNWLSHVFAAESANLIFSGELKSWRSETLGIKAASRTKPVGTLYAYSPNITPAPKDWKADVAVTGYWFLDFPDWRPPAELERFLAAGPAPVYVGFGSMPGIDPEALTRLVLEALAQTGNRAVLATGGGALLTHNLPENVMALAEAPHDWLLPRVACTIHHGGAGTTGASLRAGIPTILCPFLGDQPYWARRVEALGVGPPALNRKALSAESFAKAISATGEPEMQARAKKLGEKIRGENGTDRAANFIEKRARVAALKRR